MVEYEDEKTLAATLETINEKLNLVIEEQKNIEEQISKNKKATMQKLQKLQEYNEIDDMRNTILNRNVDKIEKIIGELEKRLY